MISKIRLNQASPQTILELVLGIRETPLAPKGSYLISAIVRAERAKKEETRF